MVDNEVLSIEIRADIKNATQNMATMEARIKQFQTSIDSLRQRMATMDDPKEINAAQKSLKTMQKQQAQTQNELASAQKEFTQSGLGKQYIDSLKAQANIYSDKSAKAGSKAWQTRYQNMSDSLNQQASALGSYDNELEKTRKTEDKEHKVTKKSNTTQKRGLGQMMKRILLYRVLRLLLQSVIQGVSNGMKAYASMDEQANATLSSLKQGLTQMYNTLGITVVNLLEGLAPTLELLESLVTAFADKLNQAMAMAKGMTTYTKVLKDETEDYAASVQAVTTGFDKFETLSGQSSYETETAQVEENVSGVADLISSIKKVVDDIVGSVAELLKKLLSSQGFKSIMNIVTMILDAVDEIINSLMESGIFDAIINIIDNLAVFLENTLKPIIDWVVSAIKYSMPVIDAIIQAINVLVLSILPPLQLIFMLVEALLKLSQTSYELSVAFFTGKWGSLGDKLSDIWTNWSSANFNNYVIPSTYTPSNFNTYAATGANFAVSNALGDSITSGVYNGVVAANSQMQNNMAVYLDGKKVGVATAQGAYGEMVRAGYIK